MKKATGVQVKGVDFFEAMRLLKDPEARRKDFLLFIGKRVVGSKKKWSHLKDSQIRSIAWFADLPEAYKSDPEYDFQEVVLTQSNLHAAIFLETWLRHPEEVSELLPRMRQRLSKLADDDWDIFCRIRDPKKHAAKGEPNSQRSKNRAEAQLKPSGDVQKFVDHQSGRTPSLCYCVQCVERRRRPPEER